MIWRKTYERLNVTNWQLNPKQSSVAIYKTDSHLMKPQDRKIKFNHKRSGLSEKIEKAEFLSSTSLVYQ